MSGRAYRWDKGLRVRVMGLLAFLLILVTGLGATLSLTFMNVAQLHNRANQTRTNVVVMGQVTGAFTEMTSALRGYLLAGQEVFLKPYGVARERLTAGLDSLREAADSDPEQLDRLTQIGTLAADFSTRVAEPEIAARRAGSADAGRIITTGSGLSYIDEIRRLGSAYIRIESERLDQEGVNARRAAEGMQRLTWIAVSIAAMLTVAGFMIFDRGFRRSIGSLAAVAERIAGGERGVRVTSPLDGEFQVVADAFTAMSVTVAAQEERLLAQNQELANLDRLKSEFVSTVSHELRTPLTSMTGYLTMVLREQVGPLKSEQREFLEVVARNTTRLSMLINDLLDIQSMESGQTNLDGHPVSLTEVVSQVAETFRVAAEQKGLEFVVNLPTEPVPQVLGDRDRLQQVAANLVNNAIKYTPAGRVTVTLTSTGATVCLDVADTGVGIPPDEQPRVFDRFFRGRGRYIREAGGTGLGLAIVKALVEEHQGQIVVESNGGAGTLVRLTLPALGNQDMPPEPQ